MLRITVIQFNGSAPSSPQSFDFDERGGTIGREPGNQLLLPDPERMISRLQAQVSYADGEFRLVDHGSNPTSVNGRAIGKGNRCPLRDGDEIGVGNYVLRVEALRPAPAFASGPAAGGGLPQGDPLGLFGEPAGQDARPAAQPAQPAAPRALAPQASVPPPAADHADDPFAVFAVPASAKPAPPKPPSGMPDDPFAAFGARPPARPTPPVQPASSSSPTSPLGMELGPGAEANSLDDLFDLDKGSSAHDPFAATPLASPALAPTVDSAKEDPLALLSGEKPQAPPPTERNDTPILRDAFTPPRASDAAAADAAVSAPPAVPPAAETPRPPPSGSGAVSWGDGAIPATAVLPRREAGAGAMPRARVSVEGFGPPDATPATPQETVARPPDLDNAALTAAFVRGLGVPGLKLPEGITPEFMEHVGVMLREAVQGTVELLIARASVKREVRADVTMIISSNNNPLKFSPNVDFALTQLLTPQGSGFLPPTEAMRDAYDDLRAHQLGFMAGMRGAIAGMLARFKPEDLEKRLTERSLLDSLLPATRKGKLWDLFEQRFAEISQEAQDDFHTLFGKEFLKAYEAQIASLHEQR